MARVLRSRSGLGQGLGSWLRVGVVRGLVLRLWLKRGLGMRC